MSTPSIAIKFISRDDMLDLKLMFPYASTHPVSYNCAEWNRMQGWLNSHVGAYEHEWNWERTDEIRFRSEDHMIEFALSWGGK